MSGGSRPRAGNVTQLVDGTPTAISFGRLAAHYEYDPFGNLLNDLSYDSPDDDDPWPDAGEYAALNPFRFSTKRTDFSSGLVHFGRRDYLPSFGRWTTRDPIAEAGGLNLYGFVGNGPVNAIDPLGMQDSGFTRYLDRMESSPDGARAAIDTFNFLQTVAVLQSQGGAAEFAAGFLVQVLSANTDPGGWAAEMMEHGLDSIMAAAQTGATGKFAGTLYYEKRIAAGDSPLWAAVQDIGKDLRGALLAGALGKLARLGQLGKLGQAPKACAAARSIAPQVPGLTGDAAEALAKIGDDLAACRRVQDRLQELADELMTQLADDPELLRKALSKAQLDAAANHPELANAFYGKGFEKLLAQRVSRDSFLRPSIEYAGRGRGPDFVGKGTLANLRLELTTLPSIESHLSRPYGNDLLIIMYERTVSLP